LFDVYPSGPDEVTVWIIAENGERIKLIDRFTHRIYVSGNFADLCWLVKKLEHNKAVADWRFAKKYADFMDGVKRRVLEIAISDYGKASGLARQVLRRGGYERFRLHNVDVQVSQVYFYEKNIFPLAYVMVVDSGKRLYFDLLDSVESVDYRVPPFRSLWLSVAVKREGPVQKMSDKIDHVCLVCGDKEVTMDGEDEREIILRLVDAVKREDPDLFFTEGGDSFWLPYLAHRAFVNGVLDSFILGRDLVPLKATKAAGTSFFSYGRVYHKSPTRRLFGRVHIDVNNTFIYTASGLNGLVEVSRVCRVPLHRAARASIGTIMSSLQLYTAWKEKMLIPWKKGEPESFKSGWELLVADRGGFIFEPRLGFHSDVVEVDFTSMFPTLMLTRNISGETVLCKCCPNSKLRVPELGYNLCEKRKGLVPRALGLLLKKRSRYKGLMEESENKELKHVYNMRQGALKWILVTCFGYLGYRNARFGKVDAHIAVCAFARDVLLKTARMAEERGFEIIHGIVDSLWLKKPGASPEEVAEFCREVSRVVNVPLNVEGRYRWIVFLPSKVLSGVPVLNRFFGVFETGEMKLRGVEARRGDTPCFVAEAQLEMIKNLAQANDLRSFQAKIPEALHLLGSYVDRLVGGDVDVCELLVTKRLSKDLGGYAHDVFQAIAAKQLEKAGFEVYSGQTVQYLITNGRSKFGNDRVVAAQLLDSHAHYDVGEYVDMLISAAETILGMFGYTKDRLMVEAKCRQKQLTL